jgi:hypothetical protein
MQVQRVDEEHCGGHLKDNPALPTPAGRKRQPVLKRYPASKHQRNVASASLFCTRLSKSAVNILPNLISKKRNFLEDLPSAIQIWSVC